jgi:hypothetical protein
MATYCYPFRDICEQNQTFGQIGRRKLRLGRCAFEFFLANRNAFGQGLAKFQLVLARCGIPTACANRTPLVAYFARFAMGRQNSLETATAKLEKYNLLILD